MNDVDVMRCRRQRLLGALYEKTAGDVSTVVPLAGLAAKLGLTRAEAAAVGQYLEAEGWMRTASPDGRVSITHAGVRRVEAMAGRPPDAAEGAVGDVEGCQRTLSGGPAEASLPRPASMFVLVENANQAIIGPCATGNSAGVDRVADFVADVRRRQAALELDLEAWEALKEQVATLEAQLQARRPRPGVVREALASARRILESAASGAAGTVASELARQAATLI